MKSMLMTGALMLAAGAFVNCSGVDCRASCEASAEELRNAAGVENPCTEDDWDEADSCEECDQVLSELYGLQERSFCEEDD